MQIKTLKPGVLTVAVYYGFGFPFANDANNGSDVLYIRKFAQEHNLSINFVELLEFDNIWLLPGQDKCDISIGGINFFTNRINKGTVWSDIYFNDLRSFLIKKEDTLNGPDDLANKTVSVNALESVDQDSVTVEDLKEWIKKDSVPNVTITYVENETKSAEMVLAGVSFAAGAEYSINQYLASLPEFSSLKLAWVHQRLLSNGTTGTEPYEFPVREASTGLIGALNKFILKNPYDIANITAPQREYDQIVSGDVSITKKGDKKYKIVFNQISDFLLYQVWSDQTPNFNNDRKVFNVKAVDWVKTAFPNPPANPPYQPTCVMELDFFNRYVFVIKKAKVKHEKVVFTVSTKEINLTNPTGNLNLLTVIPQGTFLGMRFDIDGLLGPPRP